MSDLDFKNKAILNFDLTNHLIQNSENYNSQYQVLLKQLSDNSETSKEFIFSYIEISEFKEKFICEIVKVWDDIWIYIDKESDFTKEKKDEYLHLILYNAQIKDIIASNKNNHLTEYINKQKAIRDFDKTKEAKFQELFMDLDIKLEFIEYSTENQLFFDFIYKSCFYELNEEMINQIINIKVKSKNGNNLKKAHLTAIKNSKLDKLIKYINENIDEYINNVFLKIDTNTNESESNVIELLNNDEIGLMNIKAIIEKEM